MTRRLVAILVLVASSFGVVAGLTLGVVRTAATWYPVAETGEPGHLWLMTDEVERFELSPGEPHHWDVRVSLTDPLGTLSMQIRREGELIDVPDALMVLVRQCAVEWEYVQGGEASCDRGRVDLLGPIPLSDPMFGAQAGAGDPTPTDAPTWDLGTIANSANEFYLVTLWIEDTPENRNDSDLMGLEATVGLGFLSEAADAPPTPRPPLAYTGGDLGIVGLVAISLLGIVIGIRLLRRAS